MFREVSPREAGVKYLTKNGLGNSTCEVRRCPWRIRTDCRERKVQVSCLNKGYQRVGRFQNGFFRNLGSKILRDQLSSSLWFLAYFNERYSVKFCLWC